jgi:peptidylprolyl isomerase
MWRPANPLMQYASAAMRPPLRPLATLLALAAALPAAACGDDESAGSAAAADQERRAAAEAQLKDTTAKPVLAKPTGAPPRRLVKEDIVRGKGRAAKRGDRVTVQYVGVSFSTGEQFDASWDIGQPFSFRLGAGEVIPGWDGGIVGMKRSGRRKLTIPPELAYGARGSPPDIAPNETLVFVVDLVSIG